MAIEDNEKKPELGEVLQQVSGQLRSSLNNIYRSLERIAPPELRDQESGLDVDAAILCQSYYRILRLANNLSDAAILDKPIRARLRNDDIVGFCRDVIRRVQMPAELLGLELDAEGLPPFEGEKLPFLTLLWEEGRIPPGNIRVI